jgi:hypothetical protein
LLQAAAGVRLSGLLLPAGLAVIIGVLDLAVRVDALRPLAVPLVVGLAAIGLALAWPFSRPPLWPTLAAVAVFAVFAAPIVLSGHATFAGYIKLDDTATFFALTDRAFTHALNGAGLPPSSYEATVSIYFASGYPVGSFLPFGLGHRLLDQDIAWLYAPYLAFLAAMLALALESIAVALVRFAWQRAAIAFFAAQAALLYGYALWGGVKELAAAFLVPTFVAVCPLRESMLKLRAWIPPAIVAAAMVAANTVGGLIWLLPAAAAAVLISAPALGLRRLARSGVVVPAALALGAILLSLTAGGFLEHNLAVLRGEQELGNLIRPLNPEQILGVWPAGDFRMDPNDLDVTHVLVAFVAAAGIAGLIATLIRRAWPVALYILAAGSGALVIGVLGSPWLAGKAFATASPAFVFIALLGAAILLGTGRRAEAAMLAVVIAGGVLWSNALAYHDVSLAPHDQLAELEHIGARVAGEGPALMTDYNPYGVRHLLRAADAEGASELRRRLVPLRNGQPLPKGATADLNQFALSALLPYRTLVIRRVPLNSRPPAPFSRTFAGRYYDVWQRPVSGSPSIVGELSLGTGQGAVPDCRAVRALAATAGVATLAAAPAADPPPVTIPLGGLSHSPWPRGADASLALLNHAGSASVSFVVPRAARYAIWVGGGVRGTVSAAIDGVALGSARDQLQDAGGYVELGERGLAVGPHTLKFSYAGSDWRPGSGGPPPMLGPLAIASADPPAALLRVAPSAARRLCGRRLYWVEALGG